MMYPYLLPGSLINPGQEIMLLGGNVCGCTKIIFALPSYRLRLRVRGVRQFRFFFRFEFGCIVITHHMHHHPPIQTTKKMSTLNILAAVAVLALPLVSAETWGWKSGENLCAGIITDCTDLTSCTTTGVGPCTGKDTVAPTAYLKSSLVGIAFVDNDKVRHHQSAFPPTFSMFSFQLN